MFLKGGGALDINSVRKKPKDWIPDSVWLAIIALSSMDAFRDVPDSVFRNDGLWRQWYDQEAPEMAKVRAFMCGRDGVKGACSWLWVAMWLVACSFSCPQLDCVDPLPVDHSCGIVLCVVCMVPW